MGSKRNSKNFSNSFAALALHEEQEPSKVLQMQSSRSQKKLEYQAKKALCGSSSHSSKPRQQQQQQQRSLQVATSGTSSSTPVRADSFSPGSPGLEEALAAIAMAESQQLAQQQQETPWGHHHHHQQQQQEATAAAERATSLAPAGCNSLSASASISSEYSAWGNLAALQDSSTDPWGTSSTRPPQQQQYNQQQQQQQGYQQAVLSSSPSNPYSCLQQQQQEDEQEPWPSISHQGLGDSYMNNSSSSSWEGNMSQAQAYSWRAFAMRFAEAARAAGAEDAADGALLFGASESLAAAVFTAGDAAAAVELEGIAEQAAAAGLSVEELVQAQQAELLLQINKSKRKGPAWRQVALDWGNSSSGRAADGSNSSSCASPAAQSLQLPDVDDESAFPGLESSPSSSSWQQVGRSPHAIPKGWKGGRMAPKPKGVKLLHTSNSSSSAPNFKPSTLDLHWALRMDGLAPMQRDSGDGTGWNPLCSLDPWGGVSAGDGSSSEAEAAVRTRALLAEQEAAAAAAAGGGRTAGSGNRDGFGQDAVRAMMERAAKGTRLVAAGASAESSSSQAAATGAGDMDDDDGPCGSKALYSYNWASLWESMRARGWQYVNKNDGGGGSHFKFRRPLPYSGVTQTFVMASTPSDSQRGIRNVAASLKRKDDEMRQLEDAAKARLQQQQQQQQQATNAPAKGKGKRK